MTDPSPSVLSVDPEELAEVVSGGGSPTTRGLVITGAPGIGKSTTLEALGRRLLARGVDTRRTGGDHADRARPYGVVTDLLGMAPVAPPRPDTVDDLVATVEGQARRGPLALCVDDAHRADPDSLDVLTRLPDLVGELPVVIVLARRTAPERPALSTFAVRSDVVTVELRGLDGDARVELVRRRYGVPPAPGLSALLEDTAGNPFHIRALLDELDRRGALLVEADGVGVSGDDASVPASVEAGIRAHLALLDPPAHELVRALAVRGVATDVTVLADALGEGPAAVVEPVRAAVATGVLRRTTAGRLAFSHDLYRDVVLADLDPSTRRTWHEAWAEALHRRGASTSTVAGHIAVAGGSGAVAALRAAATELRHAPAQAAELLARAARIAADPQAGPDTAALADPVAVDRARALAFSGEVRAAEQVARERLAHSRDPATHAALRTLLIFCLISDAQVDAAIHEIDATTARAPDAEVRHALADARRWVVLLGGRRRLEGPPQEAAHSVSGLVSDALELYLAARPAEGYERAVKAAGLPAQPGNDSPSVPFWPAFVALPVHGPARARALSLEARREAQDAGKDWLTPYQQSLSGGIHFHLGSWDDALAELESALEAAEVTGTAWTSITTATVLQILVRRAELDEAERVLRRWRVRGLPEQFGLPHVAHAEMLLLEARAREEDAARLAGRTWTRALTQGRRIWPLIAGPDTLRVARAAGDHDLVARVAGDTAAIPLAHAPAFAPVARLVAAMAAGDPRAASAAALDHRAVGLVPGETTAWEETACLAAAAGAPDEARTAAARCSNLAASLGAATVERRLAARLRLLDVRLGPRGARRRPSTGWESLTPTQLQVAELVGRGLTSPQVATRLYVSPRTVQTHISHILRKLDLRSRVELAAALSRRNLTH